jgi:hypothetical protein
MRKLSLLCLFLLACSREKTSNVRSESALQSAPGAALRALPALDPGEPRSFALLELFTSEGCSSCPPADRQLAAATELAERSGRQIITLSFHVDYWNDSAFADPFSDARYTQRQQHYLQAFQRRSAYTPELVVNGSEEFVGSDETALRDSTMRALSRPAKVAVSAESELRGTELVVRYASSGSGERAALQIAVFQSKVASRIDAGENSGAAIEHRNVVRDLSQREVSLPANGEQRFELGDAGNAADLGAVVLVSDPRSRSVWGATVGRKVTALR